MIIFMGWASMGGCGNLMIGVSRVEGICLGVYVCMSGYRRDVKITNH